MQESTRDVVVIGAGPAGLTPARRLVEARGAIVWYSPASFG